MSISPSASSTTFILVTAPSDGEAKRGADVRYLGVSDGGNTLVSHDDGHLVIKSKGYQMNPGSRNSGSLYYYPSETSVYRVVEDLGHVEYPLYGGGHSFKAEHVTTWRTRPGK